MTLLRNDSDTTTLTPRQIVESFFRAYKLVHNREAHVTHISGDWYRVNGEIVHRITLLGEISRLHHLAQRQRLINADRSVVQRLIARLRGL
jgi:hypothetical protein